MATNLSIPDAIVNDVRRIIAETLRLPVEQVALDARLDEARLGIDSLGLIKLNVALEEAFDITLPDFTMPEQPHIRSVGDVAALVAEKVSAQANGGAR
ncbi:acyl carrier protein [Polyangium sp. y55x31]|uniref:acyl carrier protein n=1 Tax=Polyangium sp. y55x31 TaxID=3042688 RepID=UPI002482DBE4|nr:acyl carrier protein [Polyangium sp. y55x31]MDI1481059.1 acyl carrier protein [Polyangium sp. y55x31]